MHICGNIRHKATAWNMPIAGSPCCQLQKGKCSVSGELFLNPDNIVCHMKVPKEQGGHERYSNLVLLHRRYLPLLTDQDAAALKSMCKQLTVTRKQLTKINSLRTAAKTGSNLKKNVSIGD